MGSPSAPRAEAGSAGAPAPRLRATQWASRPLCPDYRSAAVRRQPREAGYAPRRRLTKSSAIRAGWRWSARERGRYVHCCGSRAKALAAYRNGRYSGWTCHVSPSCCRAGGARVLCACGFRWRCAITGQGAGRLRHQGRAERPLERGDLPLAEGGRDRSHLRRRRGTTSPSRTSTRAISTRPRRPTRRRCSWIRRT